MSIYIHTAWGHLVLKCWHEQRKRTLLKDQLTEHVFHSKGIPFLAKRVSGMKEKQFKSYIQFLKLDKWNKSYGKKKTVLEKGY